MHVSAGSRTLRSCEMPQGLRTFLLIAAVAAAPGQKASPEPVAQAVLKGGTPVPWRQDARCGPHFKVQFGDEIIPGECPANEKDFRALDPEPENAAWRGQARCCHISLGWCGKTVASAIHAARYLDSSTSA
eukprot:TRINITY_DN52480_c0_g1_i2.p1 TRINITY_DN52480_c0_g1~~TRINITY_DN52480_c0_g1_i2.p1  ORF type:complete len:131 (+),score=20.54 TRINITY_DN52480_c0_g1_i2:79-471(+)